MATREKTEQVRQHIIEATDNLLYRKGFNLMSFSDIAQAADVPRGNLYYYFKTKDEILNAIIEHRLEQMSLMLKEWDETLATPLERLKRFAKIPLNELNNVTLSGCPMGSLNTELGKAQPELQKISRKQFDLFKAWLIKQFQNSLPEEESEQLAMHMLVCTQGIATMAHIYGDEELVKREVVNINHWLKNTFA